MKGNKKTFTYAAHESVVDKARKKAFKEGITVSEKINEWLNEYVKPVKKNLSEIKAPDWIEKHNKQV